MRILVVGHSGQVAQAFVEVAGQHEVIAVGRPELDLTEEESAERVVAAVEPDAIINAAAYTAVDKAEQDEAQAIAVNAGVWRLGAAARARGIPLIHISTDYVFDGGASTPYREDHPTAPLGAYGRSKLIAEQRLMEAMPEATIVRTAWVFHHGGTNFLRTMLRLAETRAELNVVADQVGSPTYAPDLAAALIELLDKAAGGTSIGGEIFHLTGSGSTSWHGFAERIFEGAARRGLPVPGQVNAIPTAAYPTPAARPAYSVLDGGKARALGVELPHWGDALERCLDRIVSAAHVKDKS